MKTKIIVFLLALALLMLVAIPATAGPALALPLSLELPAFGIASPAAMSIPTLIAEPVAYRSPIIESAALSNHPLIAEFTRYTIYIAMLATLAVLIWGLRTTNITSYHRMQKAGDRMHGLARDQDAYA